MGDPKNFGRGDDHGKCQIGLNTNHCSGKALAIKVAHTQRRDPSDHGCEIKKTDPRSWNSRPAKSSPEERRNKNVPELNMRGYATLKEGKGGAKLPIYLMKTWGRKKGGKRKGPSVTLQGHQILYVGGGCSAGKGVGEKRL